MKIVISLGSRELVLEPETEFEKEVLRKYFQQERDIETYMSNDGSLSIKWSGPAAGS